MSPQTAKEQILTKIRSSHDFPVMSSTISLINKLDASNDTSVAELSNIILNDHALISKILKLVNSVNYVEFGEVTTISRAIVLLGFENIKNLAMTLLLFEHFKKGGATDVVDSIVKSIFSGTLARKISGDLSFVSGEEAFICSLFHSFGKMIAGFYLPEEYQTYQKRIQQHLSDSAAAAETFGLSFEELGMTIAKEWNFPVRIIQSMRKLRVAEVCEARSDIDKLCTVANFSNEICGIIATGSKDTDKKLGELLTSYGRHFGQLENGFGDLLKKTFQDISSYAHVFNINLQSMPFCRQLTTWASGEISPEPTGLSALGISSAAIKTIETLTETATEVSPEIIFISGVQEMNNSLLQSHPLNDIIRIALETMYRGLSFFGKAKTLFFIKDTRQPIMAVRFGFGSDIEQTMRWFRIPLSEQDNFFNLAVAKQTDLVIKDIEAPDIRQLVPEWYRAGAGSGLYVIVLPIIVNAKPIGLFYAEGDRDSLTTITGGQLKYLTILRDTTVLAIKQRQG
ncbi:MAG TPA: HDOD domain-containing protein [Dissulfurispiraceae bacterium]|nr:HDOD domain-containing protein [Dissulfurispiraceae bacterium]